MILQQSPAVGVVAAAAAEEPAAAAEATTPQRSRMFSIEPCTLRQQCPNSLVPLTYP